MKTNALIKGAVVLIYFLGLLSCASEELEVLPVDPFKEGSVPLEIPFTKSVNGADPEKRVGSVRMIILKGNRVTNNILVANIPDTQTDVILSAEVPIGTVDYFLIVNERLAWGFGTSAYDVGAVVFPKTIKEKILTFTAHPIVDITSNFIPMFRHYEGVQFTKNVGEAFYEGTNIYTALGEVERLYAKASLTLRALFVEQANGNEPIEIESISVRHMPRESYLAPALYSKTSFFDGVPPVLDASNYFADADSFRGEFSFYMPEYLVTDTAHRTYFSAVVRVKSDHSLKKTYKIVLGNGIVDIHSRQDSINYYMTHKASVRQLRIDRNSHYMIQATIVGFDRASNHELIIKPEVVDWGLRDVDPNLNQYNLTVSQDEFFVTGATTYTGTVKVTTNYPAGWTATCAQAGVTLTPSGNTLTFTIPAIAGTYIIKVIAGNITKEIKITR